MSLKWCAGADADYKVLFFQKRQAIADQMRGHIDMPRAARKSSNPKDCYRKAMFAPFLGHVVMQLNERFKKHNTSLSSIKKKLFPVAALELMPVHFKAVSKSTKLFRQSSRFETEFEL